MNVLILIFTICIKLVHSNSKEWLDPHDMNTNAKSRIIQSTKQQLHVIDENLENATNAYECNIHLKRLINLLINNAQFDKTAEIYALNLNIQSNDYNFLKSVGETDLLDMPALKRVHNIFENSINRKYEFYNSTITLSEKIMEMFFNTTTIILLFLLLFLFNLLRSNFSTKVAIKHFFGYSYLIDFGVTYKRLIDEAETANFIKTKTYAITPECNVSNMKWTQYFSYILKSTFSESDCAKYHKAANENWLLLVTPVKVFAHQLETFLVEPCRHVGSAIGAFTHGMFVYLPWGLNVVLLPLMLILVCFILFMFVTFLTRTNIKIKFPFASLEFTPPSPIFYEHNQLRHNNRLFIEDVSNNEQSDTRRQIESKEELNSRCGECRNKVENKENCDQNLECDKNDEIVDSVSSGNKIAEIGTKLDIVDIK